MGIRYGTILSICLGCASTVWAAPPDVRLPSLPTPSQPVIPPVPAPSPDTVTKLGRGQFFIIGSQTPLLVDPIAGAGNVSVGHRKPPFMVPAELAVGYPVDPSDPEYVTFNDPYIYVVRPAVSGPVTLEIIPAVNALDKDGKPIPLKRADIIRRALAVDTGGPAPVTPVNPIKPDAFTQSVLDAYAAEPATYTAPDGRVWTKSECVSKLAALYANAATTVVRDESVKTYGDLFAVLKPASEAMLPPAAIPGVRRVVGAHINAALATPPDAAPKSGAAINRDITAAELTTIATALRSIK